MRLRAVLAALPLLVVGLVPGASAAPATSVPSVRGPIGDAGIHGHGLWESWFELRSSGYTEAEYFLSGTARSDNGKTTAPFTTRIIVARPSSAKRFNGTAVLDWVNVTAQFENAVDTISAHEMFLRDGYAFVHASVQSAGICCSPLTPKTWDPVRYSDLNHPGDDYAFDIFTQMARALRTPGKGVDPMGGLRPKRILAVGQSQSASRLGTYVREVQPKAKAIDGFLVHGGSSKVFKPAPAAKVFHLLSELEADTEKPNTTTNYALWEIAGASHSDFWTGYHQIVGQGPYTLGEQPKRPRSGDARMHAIAGNYGETIHPMHAVCIAAGAAFPMRYAVNASIHHLNTWVATGKRPPVAPRFTFDGDQLARDGDLNGIGGVRLPPVVVPVASYITIACGLGGITVPFSTPQLLLRYPTHAAYYAKMRAATARSVIAGFMLPADAKDLLGRACRAIARWDPTKTSC